MYEFQPRFPIDHALAFYRAISAGDYDRGDLLILTGAITGEIGALLKANSVSLSDGTVNCATEEELLGELAKLENVSLDDASFNPGIWIPIILKLVELWLKRRG